MELMTKRNGISIPKTMKKMIQNLPMPFCGLMLASTATGNLLETYSPVLHGVFGGIAFLFMIMILLKIILFPQIFWREMRDPVLFSVFGAFTMAMFFISAYLKELIGQSAIILWYFNAFIYVIYIIYFTVKFVLKINIKDVYTGYLIVYVGIIALSNTAQVFHQETLGQLVFWLGVAFLTPNLLLLAYRYVKYPNIKKGLQPLFGVYAAPFALCLVGYMKSFPDKSHTMIMILLALSLMFYLLALTRIISIFTREFYPSFASYTFPFVNSAIALKLVIAYYDWTGIIILVNNLQIILAVFLVLYVMTRYFIYFINLREVV